MENTTPFDFSSNLPKSPQPPVSLILATMILLALLGAGFGALLSIAIGSFYGINPDDIQSIIRADMNPAERSFVRWMLALNHLFTFIFPGIATLLLFCEWKMPRPSPFGRLPEHWSKYLRADKLPSGLAIFLGILLTLVSLPLVHYLYGINQMLPLPNWATGMEDQTTEALKGILKMDSPLELLANLLIMALIPAIGEELIFRGIVQRQLMRVIPNVWLAILVAGAIFSAIHLQFEGFLPRWLLGCLLGWLFWQTQNFWVPVAAHFFNNAFQVVGQYLFNEKISTVDFEQDFNVPVYWAVVSVFLVWVTGRLIKNFNTEQKTQQ